MTKISALALGAVLLNTPFPRGRGIKDEAIFADAGETLVVGVDITADDAQGLIDSGGAVDATAAPIDETLIGGQPKPKPASKPAGKPRGTRIKARTIAEGEKLVEGTLPVPIESEPIEPPTPDETGDEQ